MHGMGADGMGADRMYADGLKHGLLASSGDGDGTGCGRLWVWVRTECERGYGDRCGRNVPYSCEIVVESALSRGLDGEQNNATHLNWLPPKPPRKATKPPLKSP